MSQHPVISLDLEKALSAIQKSAEERLEVLKSKKKEIEQGESSVETVPKLIRALKRWRQTKKLRMNKKVMVVAVVAEGDVGGRQMADKGAAITTTGVGGADRWPTEVSIPDKECN